MNHPATLTTRQWSTLLSRCERAGRGELADAIRLALLEAYGRGEATTAFSVRSWSILVGLARERPRDDVLARRLEEVLAEALDAARVVVPIPGGGIEMVGEVAG